MPQPAVQAPLWQTFPVVQLEGCASFALVQPSVLVPGWQVWQLPLAAPSARRWALD